MKIVSFNSGEWYHCDFVPDGNGTFEIISAVPRATLAGGPEGIVFVPPGSPVFPANSVLINNWSIWQDRDRASGLEWRSRRCKHAGCH